jgi:hypothetical protein
MLRKLPSLVSSLALALSLTGCDKDDPSAPAYANCLYESAVCSEGEYGTGCPPGADAYTTECIDTTTNTCVQAGQESEWDYELATTYYYYTENPRIVQGVTCADWESMPGLDPYSPTTCAYENDGECDVPNLCPAGTDLADCEPLTCAYENDGECDVPDFCPEGTDLADCEPLTCAYENDGECDVPEFCPEGTDLADCELTCEVFSPDPADCYSGTQDALWCSNAYGGMACSEGADLYVCNAGYWVSFGGAAADQYCQDYGFTTYYGCEGTFDTAQAYCD